MAKKTNRMKRINRILVKKLNHRECREYRDHRGHKGTQKKDTWFSKLE
jgi:hypothetical protein